MRRTLEFTLIVVKAPDGREVEIDPSEHVGNLDADASISFRVGRVIREMLLAAGDGEEVTVTAFDQ